MVAWAQIWIQFENFIEREFSLIKLLDKLKQFYSFRDEQPRKELKFPATARFDGESIAKFATSNQSELLRRHKFHTGICPIARLHTRIA